MPNGRVCIGVVFKGLNSIHPDDIGDELLFTRLEKTPTFPGCEERDSDCFLEKLQEYFDTNFNSKITKNLGLRPGKEKVNLEFNIDLNGNVTDLKVRASRKIIKDEVIKIMSLLPKMTHGEKYGKPIKAKYVLPITFSII
ncbi:energy transducer TonB [Polaribacter ponticola]|uniref:Energy transducer TonB n=1 Tax=Polaribacter ponticola TaxID=2978475 RepID=A0ABT5SB56_9FLAO|nr:energy transducer TonB [Polaribacter sp. MSW5]MDD7914835.1 energy transducer TonB [Polaribacter sp. MSW5]